MGRLVFLLVLVLGLFFLQTLLLPLPQTRLDLLGLLVFYEGAGPFFLNPILLALFLGIVVGSYSTAPLGLQAGGYLLIVMLARFFRRHLNLQLTIPQILAAGITLGCQGVVQLWILHILDPGEVFHFQAIRFNLERALVTALLAPPAFGLWGWLDNCAKRYFYQSWSASVGHDRSE